MLTKVVVVGHAIIWLIQVQVIHHPLRICLLRINYLRKEGVFSADTIYNNIPCFELLSHHGVGGTVYIDALTLQALQIVCVTISVVPVKV